MAKKSALPQMTGAQVVELQDELLANADRLLQAALAALELDNVGLARSLVILGMEESGKAIAIHQRQVAMAYEPEGEPFVNQQLRRLWADHRLKLELVHSFLAEEEYWLVTGPPDIARNLAWLGNIEDWAGQQQHNALKQRGFYVDVNADEGVLTPAGVPDTASLREVISATESRNARAAITLACR